jgi:hypothetical protein
MIFIWNDRLFFNERIIFGLDAEVNRRYTSGTNVTYRSCLPHAVVYRLECIHICPFRGGETRGGKRVREMPADSKSYTIYGEVQI